MVTCTTCLICSCHRALTCVTKDISGIHPIYSARSEDTLFDPSPAHTQKNRWFFHVCWPQYWPTGSRYRLLPHRCRVLTSHLYHRVKLARTNRTRISQVLCTACRAPFCLGHVEVIENFHLQENLGSDITYSQLRGQPFI